MENCERPRRCGRRPVWRPLSYIGLPVLSLSERADRSHHGRRRSIRKIKELATFEKSFPDELKPTADSTDRSSDDDSDKEDCHDDPYLEDGFGNSRKWRVQRSEQSRFKLLPPDELMPTEASVDRSYDDDSDKEDRLDDPYLEDGFGNLTKWRLSDLRKGFIKHLEDESNRPRTKERKHSKDENMKLHNDLMEQYMKSALKKYNNEEKLDEDLGFEFVKAMKESFIVEGRIDFYRHFNFTAMQNGTIHLFFTEVIPDVDNCDVTCCRLLHDNDNGRCLGCKNQGDPDLRHPASNNLYAGGHKDCAFPFLIDSDSEDDSD